MNIYGRTKTLCNEDEILKAYKVLQAIHSTEKVEEDYYETMDCEDIYGAVDCGMFFLHKMAKEIGMNDEEMNDQCYDYDDSSVMYQEPLMDAAWLTLDSMLNLHQWSEYKAEINTAKEAIDYYKPVIIPLFVDMELANKYEKMMLQIPRDPYAEHSYPMELDQWTVFSGIIPGSQIHLKIHVRVVTDTVDTWTELIYEFSRDGLIIWKETEEVDSFIGLAELPITASDINEGLDDFDVLICIIPVNPSDALSSVYHSLKSNQPLHYFMKDKEVKAIRDIKKPW